MSLEEILGMAQEPAVSRAYVLVMEVHDTIISGNDLLSSQIVMAGAEKSILLAAELTLYEGLNDKGYITEFVYYHDGILRANAKANGMRQIVELRVEEIPIAYTHDNITEIISGEIDRC